MDPIGNLDVKVGRKRPKNSFVNQNNSFDNQFLMSNSHIENNDSHLEDQNSSKIKKQLHNQKQIVETLDLTKEEKKIKDLNKNYQKLNSSIHELKQNYQELEEQEMVLKTKKRKQAQKEGEIKDFLMKKKKQKIERQKLKKKMEELEEKKRQEELQAQKKRQEQERQNRIRQIKKMTHLNEKVAQEKRKEAEKKKIVQNFYEKYKNQERFHQKKLKEQKLNQKKIAQQEEEIFAERKQRFKSIDEGELESHRRIHDEKMQQLEAARKVAQEQKLLKIASENKEIFDFYRGNSHTIAYEERQEKRRKKKEPHEKREKMDEYQKHIKQNYLPKTHQIPSKRQSLDVDAHRKSHREVRRYRFFKGSAMGQVSEIKPAPKSQLQQRKMGDEYLAYIRSLPKKKYEQDEKDEDNLDLDPQDLELLEKKFNSIVKVKRQFLPLYDQTHKKKTTVAIPQNPTRQELKMMMVQLKAHDEKMKQKQLFLNHHNHGNTHDLHLEQKQINASLMENMERKLSFLAQL